MKSGTEMKAYVLPEEVPGRISDGEILGYLQTRDINWEYIKTIKNLTEFNDEVISRWLNVSVKTFRSYKQPENRFKENVKEQVLVLLSLIHHGIEVFGSQKTFSEWLATPNFHFDNHNPNSFLNTITGIRFVDERLTAIEYGDNV